MKAALVPARPICILHSEDAPLRHRVAAILQERAYVCHAPDQHRLEELLGGDEPLLLFADLRTAGALELLPRLVRLHPHAVIVALGEPGTTPFRLAAESGIYRAESLEADRRTLLDLTERVIERVGWMQETQMLRDELARVRTIQQHSNSGGARSGAGRTALSLRPLVKATQNLDRLEDLFTQVVEGVASAVMVSRVGLFYRAEGDAGYRLRAGRCCLDDTPTLELGDRDPLVRWLQRHPRLITRASLDHIQEPSERALLRRTLDLLGAETFIPLNLRGRVLGWLFTGQTDGLPFDHSDHSELNFLGEHVVQAMENTLKHQEAVSQKIVGESLLQMMQTAIITVNAAARVTWCNAPAEKIFPVLAREPASAGPPGRVSSNIPVEDLGSHVGSLLLAALAGSPTTEPCVVESRLRGGRTLIVRTRQLMSGGACHGAVALVEDRTQQIRAEAQQEQLERTRFWRELAAGISHEIRNPLVAIKTFTQLLPQRHTDEEFRLEFKEMVSREVNRLESIVTQIEGFAHPATAVVDRGDLAELLKEAAESARAATGAENASLKVDADKGLPPWRGDAKAVAQCFQGLFVNSIEAAARKQTRPIVKVRLLAVKAGAEIIGLKVAFMDNGGGLPPEVLDNAFSPFSSTKAQGLGLGLALAQRVVLDHGGRMDLDSGTIGLGVNIILPLEPPPAVASTRLSDGGATAAKRRAMIGQTALPHEERATLKD